jgi:hypothetical protein
MSIVAHMETNPQLYRSSLQNYRLKNNKGMPLSRENVKGFILWVCFSGLFWQWSYWFAVASIF